jgi:hypothetical protein
MEKQMEPLVPAENELDSGIEIEIVPDEIPDDLDVWTEEIISSLEPDFNANLAEDMDERAMQSISSDILDMIRTDLDARRDWEKTYSEGVKLLGLKLEERTEPWDGACGVFHPLLTEAVVRFQSETILSTFPAHGPVKTQIVGKITKQKEEAANRVQTDMNYELTEKMVEYRSEHERLLWSLPIAGSAFKKVYFDPSLDRQVAIFIPAEDIIAPYGASDIQSAPRITHRMRKTENELLKLMASGFYRDIDLPDPQVMKDDLQDKKDRESGIMPIKDDRYVVYESHLDFNLPGYEDEYDGEETGIAIPYVVTMLSSGEILSIRRNYLEDDENKQKRQHFVHYIYIPGFGFYGFGLIHLVGGFAESATSIMRQLVDAGTLSNLPGGFKSKDLRVKGDDTPIAPGEFRDVDVTGMTLKDSILPLPYKEPSATLFNLLNTIVEEGRRFASVADLKVSDMSGQTPVGTTLAILERNLKVMSAVQARVHDAMRKEFKLLSAIVRDYTPEDYEYDVDGPKSAKKEDYHMIDVIPVSDPNASTMAQKVVQYQALLQLSSSAPQLYDMAYLHRQMARVLGAEDVNKMIPIKDDFKPRNPVAENMDIIMGKPVKAFQEQDHEAHIMVHQNAAQDPKIQKIIGQNPQAQAIQAALMAHISEHVAMQYLVEIEKMLGVSMPPADKPLPEDIENDLSRAVALASQKLLQKDQAEAQQQQMQQQQQDPLLQLQTRELSLKEAEFQHRSQLESAEFQLKQQEQMLKDKRENKRIDSQAEIAGANIGSKKADRQAELEARATESEKNIANQQLLKGVEIGSRGTPNQRSS